MPFCTAIPDFQLANPLYSTARVTFYAADVDGAATDDLATLYADPQGLTTTSNPQTLDSEGKFIAPVYISGPVVAEVIGPNVESHTTGAINTRGTWRDLWVTETVYYSTDLVVDDITGNLYVVVDNYVSGASLAADVLAGHLQLVINQNDLATSGVVRLFVQSRLAAPPGLPVNGYAYLVLPGATGAFATHDNQIATRTAGVWTFQTPLPGWQVFSEADLRNYEWNGTSWNVISTAGARDIVATSTFVVFVDSVGGLNTNFGLTVDTAFLTLQAAWEYYAARLDLAGHTIIFKLRPGSYTLVTDAHFVGCYGPSNVVIEPDSGVTAAQVTAHYAFGIGTSCLIQVSVIGTQTIANAAGDGIHCEGSGAALVYGDGLVFGACTGVQIAIAHGTFGIRSGNYTISAGASSHMGCGTVSCLAPHGAAISIPNVVTFDSFATCGANSSIFASDMTFIGAHAADVVGIKFIANGGGALITTAGANGGINGPAGYDYFPGSLPGVAINGGYWDNWTIPGTTDFTGALTYSLQRHIDLLLCYTGSNSVTVTLDYDSSVYLSGTRHKIVKVNALNQAVLKDKSGTTLSTLTANGSMVEYVGYTGIWFTTSGLLSTTSLLALGGLTPATNTFPYFDSASTAALGSVTALSLSFLGDATALAMRARIGSVIGTDVQAYDADLSALAALSGTNTIYYRSASNTWSAVTIGVMLSFSGGTLNVPFRGACVSKSAVQSLSDSTFTAIAWDGEDFDTDAVHDNVTNNTRLTVPSGVTYVEITGRYGFASNSTNHRLSQIKKNGTAIAGKYDFALFESYNVITSGPLAVTAGDYFELFLQQDSGGALNSAGADVQMRFSMKILG